jgi:hypothetical protein
MGCKRLLSFTVQSILALGSIQLPFNGYRRAVFPGLKRPRLEDDSSHWYSAEIRNSWRCMPTVPYVLVAWYSIKQWQIIVYRAPNSSLWVSLLCSWVCVSNTATLRSNIDVNILLFRISKSNTLTASDENNFTVTTYDYLHKRPWMSGLCNKGSYVRAVCMNIVTDYKKQKKINVFIQWVLQFSRPIERRYNSERNVSKKYGSIFFVGFFLLYRFYVYTYCLWHHLKPRSMEVPIV